MKCPICNCGYSEMVKFFTCESFDNSYLYNDVIIHKCNECGHLYNVLSNSKIKELRKYYKTEHKKNTESIGCQRVLSVGINDAYSIPYDDNSFDVVILNQVLEHLTNLKLVMKEIKRILTKGGSCFISVPDVERYNDDYMYIMREHVQHFSLACLRLLAQANGFELINYERTYIPMVGKLELANLSVTLKHRSKVYCFGIGREFMYKYLNTRLKHLDVVLVDDTPEKQKKTFKGMKIHSSDILKTASKDSFLIITAKVHEEALKFKASQLGYKGEIIDG